MPPSLGYLATLLALTLLLSAGHSLDLKDDRRFVFNFFSYFPRVRSQLSEQCQAVSNYFRNHSKETWAVKIVDSNSLIEPGLTSGNLQYLGSFDECIQLDIPRTAQFTLFKNETVQTVESPHFAQYCTVSFPISMVLSKNEMAAFPPAILGMIPPLAGICIPAACNSQSDLPAILQKFSQITNQSVSLNNCITRNDLEFGNRFKPEHIAIVIILVIILLLCIAGTILETQFDKRKETNFFFKILYCFSLARNFKFLFATTSTTSLVQKRKLEALQEKISQLQLNSLGRSSPSVSAALQLDGDHSTLRTPSPAQLTESTSKSNLLHSPSKLIRPQVDCLHGIRFISFLFILTYHTFTEAQVPSANLLQIIDAERNFVKQLITNAALWVDTFFLLSGFLVAHSMLYQKAKPNESETSKLWSHILQHPKRLLHRYLRLTPSVVGVLMLSILIEPLGSGPVWYQYVGMSQMTCHKNWWVLFLYINNFFRLNQMNAPPNECLSYLWYLAVDMQFYLISPLLIMFLTHSKFRLRIVGVAINLLAIVGSGAITAYLMATNGLTPTVLVTVYDLPYINQVYKASYCRIGPYCLGILLAYLLYRQAVAKSLQQENNLQSTEKKKPASPLLGLLYLVVSLAILLTVTLLTYPWLQDVDYHNAAAVLYGAVHRTVWAFGWALFIYACVHGHLNVLSRFLGCSLFQFLSKLTYQSYLLHSVLISAVTNSVRQKMYYNDFNLVLDIYKYLILTIMVSIGTFVTFERPFINLEQTFIHF